MLLFVVAVSDYVRTTKTTTKRRTKTTQEERRRTDGVKSFRFLVVTKREIQLKTAVDFLAITRIILYFIILDK